MKSEPIQIQPSKISLKKEWRSIVPKKRILLIEEEADLRKPITFTLRRQGWEVVTESNGNNAFKCIQEAIQQKKPIDLIIIDLNLPGLSGLRFIDSLRSAGIQMPFGVLTAFGSSLELGILREKGCVFCLDKPFDSDQLQQFVLKAFSP
jgi:DNA-binding response OmpR family regulator